VSDTDINEGMQCFTTTDCDVSKGKNYLGGKMNLLGW
jgi:hypothetical protein